MSIRPTRIAAVAAIALTAGGLSALGGTGSAGAAPAAPHRAAVSLFGPAHHTTATLRPAPATAPRSRLVTVTRQALPVHGVGERVALDLFADARFTGVVDSVTRHGRTASWTGHLTAARAAGQAPGSFTVARVGHTWAMNINTGHAVYTVSRSGGSSYRLSEAGPAPRTTENDATLGRPGRAARSHTAPATTAAGDATSVDVLVVYTAKALAEAGSLSALQAQIQLGITQTNQAFANSQIQTSVNLVGTQQVSGAESGDISLDLDRLQTPGDGYFDEAQAARETTHADLVSLWVGGTVPLGNTCGYSYYSTVPGQGPDWGYSAVNAAQCATDYLVFTHELGHNFGADHDPASSLNPDTNPYARGYVSGNQISIMSYYNCANPNDCTRVPYYSNPSITVGTAPIGTATNNNARQLNEAFATVAGYRESKIYPGTPAVTGKAKVGKTLTAANGDWAPTTLTFAYQWLANGSPITGATRSTLKLTGKQAGKRISVQVTGSGGSYTAVSATSASVKVSKAKLPFAPRLVGRPKVGKTLSVKLHSTVKRVAYRFVWYRNGVRIRHEQGPTHHLTARDRGTRIKVKVVATKKGYADTTRTTGSLRIS